LSVTGPPQVRQYAGACVSAGKEPCNCCISYGKHARIQAYVPEEAGAARTPEKIGGRSS
jgi:hypothetical protein